MADQEQQIERIPAHPPTPQGYATEGPQRWILMSPHMVMIGSLIAFFTGALIVVLLPQVTFQPPPSTNWVPLSEQDSAGRAIYVANGCVYCHSYFTRPQDTFVGQYYVYTRTSEPGDYEGYRESPNIFGTARTGPDLSQEGGHHPDIWHVPHYTNPRFVHPLSIMPIFDFLSKQEIALLTAFNQQSGGKEAILRTATEQVGWMLWMVSTGDMAPEDAFPDLVNQQKASGQYQANGKFDDPSPSGLGWDEVWDLNSRERGYWLTPDPLPVTQNNLMRGKELFLDHCTGCHGPQGDGKGPAADLLKPQPADFTDRAGATQDAPSSPGTWYHRILTAGKGTAMENFGTRMSVDDIWRVVNFLYTISGGSLKNLGTVPTPDLWAEWKPKPEAVNYYNTHPIAQGPGPLGGPNVDPFQTAAHWLTPGMADTNDFMMVGGKLRVDKALVVSLIRNEYFKRINKAYDDAQKAGSLTPNMPLPPKEYIMDTSHLVWHSP
jgi:cytochrome c oxidase cbb3-type subunit II